MFRPDLPVFEVRLAREHRLKLEGLVEGLPAGVFTATDSLGWVYQFWQSRKKAEVNRSEVKIGAGELPAVTQLFTEPYMVGFLLDNTLGAWWAARRLSGADLDGAGGEAGLRRKAAIPGVPLDSLRFVQDAPAARLPPAGTPARSCRGGPAGPNSPASDEAPPARIRDGRDDSGDGRPDPPASDEAPPAAGERARSFRGDGCADNGATAPGWRPAAGTFGGWPEHLGALKILDPCCGSGHFLAAAFLMLVPMRMAREGLAPRDAVDAVLRDNLYGLELDPRCVELAAFALALAAWTYHGAEGYRPLSELNVSCSGLAPNATKEQWTALAELAASAGGMPPERDLFGAEDTLLSAPLRNSLDALHELCGQAPELGSLIDPHALKADLFRSDFESVRALFAAALERERMSDEQMEHAVAARGMARAAELLAGRYHLVITNVPYLARGRQGEALRAFCQRCYPDAKNDLATVFLERCLDLCVEDGAASLVLPQNWLFLTGCRKLREKLLKTETKRTAHGPLRTDPAVLQVAVARLSGYRWPAEQDAGMELADEQREWVRRCGTLHAFADSDGIVCIPPVRGEPSAEERVLQLLAAAFGDAWSDRVLTRLLTEAGSSTLDDWLRNRFFEQHCARFHHRPFVWHVWDGRKRDGFCAGRLPQAGRGRRQGPPMPGSPHLELSRRLDHPPAGRGEARRSRRGRASGGGVRAAQAPRRHPRRRAAPRPLHPLEAHRSAARRLGAGRRRRRAPQPPPLPGRRPPRRQEGRRYTALQTERPLTQGSRQGAHPRAGAVPVVLARRGVHGRAGERRASDDYEQTNRTRSSRGAVMSSDRGLHWRYPGARWWKFDFHTHTPASRDYGKGPGQDSLKSITPREWLLGFMRAGVDCVAVTDHNSGEWVDRLKDAYQELKQESSPDFRPLSLFPGVEITANGGIHVLAVLDADKGATDVAALLGAVGYQGVRGESGSTAKSATIGVVEGISEAGGIPILAHVDGPSGAWRLTGNTLAPLFDFDGLFAMEVVDPGRPKPELYRQRKLAWAEVLGSDSHHPHGQAGSRFPGSHYTWVKMAEPSLEGLRLALLDGGGFSIRRSDDPEPFEPFALPEHCIEAIEIEDARYMGRGKPARLEFNPWLNALVGGRGTGKSTVIHAMRLAAGRGHELKHLEKHSEPLLTFERFEQVPRDRTEKGGLTKSTNVAWTMMRGGVRYRLHWRQDGSGTTVEEDAGEAGWRPSLAQTVTPERFPVRMFSQGQIAALAGENQQALLQVIDEAAGVAALQRDLEETRKAFYAAKARIRELEGRLARRNDLAVEQQDVERKLKRFEEAGHTAILTAYRHRNRQRTEAGRQFDTAEAAARHIEQAAAALQPEDLPDGLFHETSKEDRQVAAIMGALATAVRDAAQALHHVAERLRGLVATQREELAGSAWQAAVEHAAGGYEALIETLRKGGVGDPSEYGRLVQERQRLDSELARLDSVQEERDRLIERSRSLLDNVRKPAARRVEGATDS